MAQLTGITDDMVRSAPSLATAIVELQARAGSLPIVGHNVRFDLSFLAAAGWKPTGPAIDTWTLATMLIPDEGSYSLHALAEKYHLAPERHRALGDVTTTVELFRLLLERIWKLPAPVLEEIQAFLRGREWPAKDLFLGVKGTAHESDVAAVPGDRDFSRAKVLPVPDGSSALPTLEEASGLVLGGAGLSRALPNYEFRPAQEHMVRRIANSFQGGETLLVEAGTGVGKTISYLLPAVLQARKKGSRVLISTFTKTLQEQLVRKDVPVLEQVLGTPVRAAVLKGRKNYLCEERLAGFLARSDLRNVEIGFGVKLILFSRRTPTGDLGEIRCVGREYVLLAAVCSLHAVCAHHEPGERMCWYALARERALAADLVVTNHALLFLLASGDELLNAAALVIDEAHHVEEVATHALDTPLSLSEWTDRRVLLRASMRIIPSGDTRDAMDDLLETLERGMTDIFT